MFAHDFVRNAYLAGTFIALACGVVGWFVVLRGQVFAGDALSHVAFVGAIAAAVARLRRARRAVRAHARRRGGMAALGRAGPGRRRRDRDRVRLDPRDRRAPARRCWPRAPAGGTGIAAANTLFGSIYSLSPGGSRLAAADRARGGDRRPGGVVRPLLLATLDSELAVGARRPGPGRSAIGVPRRAGDRHRRGHAGGRRAAAARPARGARRGGAPAHRPPVPRASRCRRCSRCSAMWGGLALSYADRRRCRRAARSSVWPAPGTPARRCSPGFASPHRDRAPRTGWRARVGVTTRDRRRSPAAGFGESFRMRRGAHSSRSRAYGAGPSVRHKAPRPRTV